MKTPPIVTRPLGNVGPCGCTFSPLGTLIAQCRLHGQARQIQASLRIIVHEYDRSKQIRIEPLTMDAFRRFVQ